MVVVEDVFTATPVVLVEVVGEALVVDESSIVLEVAVVLVVEDVLAPTLVVLLDVVPEVLVVDDDVVVEQPVTGVYMHAPLLSHASSVHALPSSQVAGEQGADMGRVAKLGGWHVGQTAGSWMVCSLSTARATHSSRALVATTRPEPLLRPVTGASSVINVSSWRTTARPVVMVTV